jgi:hypothetical protein
VVAWLLTVLALTRSAVVAIEPTLPFLRLNKYHVAAFKFDDSVERSLFKRTFPKMRRPEFESGRFKEDAYFIDITCTKFPILDVVCLGPSRNLWDVIFGQDYVKVQYIFGAPVQLTFDQAREEVVELICSKRWFSKTQDRESEKQFRERMALCENMNDLIMGRRNTDPKTNKRFHWIGVISFYGEWVG